MVMSAGGDSQIEAKPVLWQASPVSGSATAMRKEDSPSGAGRKSVACDDLAFVAMHDRHGGQLSRPAAQQPRRPAARDGVAAAAAPGRRLDAQRAEPRKRLAQTAVTFGDQERQPEHAAPGLPFRHDIDRKSTR